MYDYSQFLGFTSLIITSNLYSISHYSSKTKHINPNNYWNWENELETTGNLSSRILVVGQPKSFMSGYEFCVHTHEFYNTLRGKRAELYLSPGITTREGVCPHPNLEIASISIAACCLLYSLIMFFLGIAKSDIYAFGVKHHVTYYVKFFP